MVSINQLLQNIAARVALVKCQSVKQIMSLPLYLVFIFSMSWTKLHGSSINWVATVLQNVILESTYIMSFLRCTDFVNDVKYICYKNRGF